MAQEADFHVEDPVSAMAFKPLVAIGAFVVIYNGAPYLVT